MPWHGLDTSQGMGFGTLCQSGQCQGEKQTSKRGHHFQSWNWDWAPRDQHLPESVLLCLKGKEDKTGSDPREVWSLVGEAPLPQQESEE